MIKSKNLHLLLLPLHTYLSSTTTRHPPSRRTHMFCLYCTYVHTYIHTTYIRLSTPNNLMVLLLVVGLSKELFSSHNTQLFSYQSIHLHFIHYELGVPLSIYLLFLSLHTLSSSHLLHLAKFICSSGLYSQWFRPSKAYRYVHTIDAFHL